MSFDVLNEMPRLEQTDPLALGRVGSSMAQTSVSMELGSDPVFSGLAQWGFLTSLQCKFLSYENNLKGHNV